MESGDRIKALRDIRGLTLEEVGNHVGVNKATVQRYESGNIDIKRNVAIKLAEILNTSPSYIMGWSDNPAIQLSSNVDYTVIEKRLLNKVRMLDDKGQTKVEDYIDDLISSNKHRIKDDKRRLA